MVRQWLCQMIGMGAVVREPHEFHRQEKQSCRAERRHLPQLPDDLGLLIEYPGTSSFDRVVAASWRRWSDACRSINKLPIWRRKSSWCPHLRCHMRSKAVRV
jgi:hypothetical protein